MILEIKEPDLTFEFNDCKQTVGIHSGEIETSDEIIDYVIAIFLEQEKPIEFQIGIFENSKKPKAKGSIGAQISRLSIDKISIVDPVNQPWQFPICDPVNLNLKSEDDLREIFKYISEKDSALNEFVLTGNTQYYRDVDIKNVSLFGTVFDDEGTEIKSVIDAILFHSLSVDQLKDFLPDDFKKLDFQNSDGYADWTCSSSYFALFTIFEYEIRRCKYWNDWVRIEFRDSAIEKLFIELYSIQNEIFGNFIKGKQSKVLKEISENKTQCAKLINRSQMKAREILDRFGWSVDRTPTFSPDELLNLWSYGEYYKQNKSREN